jgi:predicted nucleotidyltransferase
MRSALPMIAAELGADERTLRRATTRGTVRTSRPGPRKLELPPGELAYLRSHWGLLSALTRALRTEPNVALAALYGSTARGDDRGGSDVDVLVAFRDDDSASTSALAGRLQDAVGTSVDVARLSRVREESPLLLLQVLDEGRVLVDRNGLWSALQDEREAVARAARRQMSRSRAEAADSLAELLGEEA